MNGNDQQPHTPQTDAKTIAARAARRPIAAAAVILLASALLLLVPLENNYRAPWRSAALDWLHLPLFAAIYLAVHTLLRGRSLAAMLVVVAVATLTEIVQPFFGRSASVVDWMNGLLGVASAVCWQRESRTTRFRWGVLIVLAAWPTYVTGPILWDAWNGWRNFPVLCDFRSGLERNRWYLERTAILPDSTSGATFQFEPSTEGSSAVLFPIVNNWSGYRQLVCDFVVQGETLPLLLSVRDGKKVSPQLPRFDLWRQYEPGRHHVVIDLDELRRGGRFPPIDMRRIQSFHLVAFDNKPRVVRFLSAYLVP